MAKKLTEWERQHRARLTAYRKKIDAIYNKFAEDAARLAAQIGELGDKPFSFDDYPLAKLQIDELTERLEADLQAVVTDGIREEWAQSNAKNDSLTVAMLGERAASITEAQRERLFSTSPKALEQFLTRKAAGMGLSKRVWRLTRQTRQELELALDIGIRDGKAANRLATGLKQYLRYPDKLFRRVRDEHGQLRLSQAAAAFHPGRGVYRSSFMNARRLAVTETNMAYRSADFERWQKLDFVVGVEIRLSNNHNCKGVPAGRFRDICDDLAGKYPPGFKFTGWHPHCRCQALPILMTQAEFFANLDGNEVESVNAVKKVPGGFTEWIEKNKERAKGWESLPYFVRDNAKYTKGLVVNLYDAQERKFTRARKTQPAMNEAVRVLSKRYPDIPNTELAAIYHFTRGDVPAFRQLNNQLRKGDVSEFNEAFSTLLERGLEKIAPIRATTYRTVRINRATLKQWTEKALGHKEITFEGFTSSSLDRSVVENFATKHTGKKRNETDVLLKIEGTSGKPIEEISQFGTLDNGRPNQREVLFTRGARFRMMGYKKLDDGNVFKVEITVIQVE